MELSDRVGWLLLAVVTFGVLLTWAPTVPTALGDDHEGRILARHALNVTNAQADGLAASGWLSDWSPYVGDGGEQTSYAHHPPLLNLGYYLTAQVLPLPVDVAMRVFAYTVGLAMLPLGAAVLRRLGIGWWATLLATVAVAVTPLFWVYGRLHGNVTLLLAMTLLVVRVAEDRPIGRGELALAAVASLAAVIAGYLGLATAALLGLWLLSRRGIDRVTVTVGLAMGLGAAVTAAYVVGRTGADRIGEQVVTRTVGGDFTIGEFLARIAGWATDLLPWWWLLIVLPVGLAAGLIDRRTRPLVAIGTVVTLGYVGGLPNGAFIHDYWIFPVLLPVWVGLGAAGDRLAAARGARGAREVAVLTAVLALLGGFHGLRTEVPTRYVTAPGAAGALVRDVGPAPAQSVAWHTAGIAAPRWLSFYWQLPPGRLDADRVADLGGDDLVLVRLDRAPTWLGDTGVLPEQAVAARGGYLLLRGAEVARLYADG